MTKNDDAMSHRDSEEEKLVEEIATIFCRNCRCFDVRSAIGGEEGCTTGFPLLCQFAQDDAKRAIALILRAAVDGLPLPGEVGRDEIVGDDLITHIPKGMTVIVLRPEAEPSRGEAEGEKGGE